MQLNPSVKNHLEIIYDSIKSDYYNQFSSH